MSSVSSLRPPRPQSRGARTAAAALLASCVVCVGAGLSGSSADTGSSRPALPTIHSAEINAIAAASPRDVWAVGEGIEGTQNGADYVSHWNGDAWTRVYAPIPGQRSWFDGVATFGPDDAWAVGGVDYEGERGAGLIMHWDGGVWHAVQQAVKGPYAPSLTAVGGSAPDDVWAVGFGHNGLTEHWDGTSWTRVAVPTHHLNDQLLGVTAVSPTDAWAVGQHGDETPMIYHWDGAAWSLATPGGPAGLSGTLQGVSATSADDVWAVGLQYLVGADEQLFAPLIEHWNGTSWRRVAAPADPPQTIFTGVRATAPDDVWATGYVVRHGSDFRAVMDHWNGHVWSLSTPLFDGLPLAVTATGPDDAWAAGVEGRAGDGPIYLHWDGSDWTRVR